MNIPFFALSSSADQLAWLRVLGLILKLCLTFMAAETFGLSLQLEPLNYALVLEGLYLATTFKLRKPLLQQESGLFIALFLDTLFWITWLYFSGGATNAFISLLLIPIALAAVTLPIWSAWVLATISVLAYSLMIFTVPDSQMQMHGMDMSSHYLGMWFNFVISALVMTSSVALIARRMRKQDAELAQVRESQLRQEQLLALGTASAQMAHQLATPLFSMRLLVDEVIELTDAKQRLDKGLVNQMQQAMLRSEDALNELRAATEAIRDGRVQEEVLEAVLDSFRKKLQLFLPQINMEYQVAAIAPEWTIETDASLIPSLLALVDNGAEASFAKTGEYKVQFAIAAKGDNVQFLIRDFGDGIASEKLAELGHRLVKSDKGMGMALMLSHGSFERLGGNLLLSNHSDGGTLAQVTLPLTLTPSSSL